MPSRATARASARARGLPPGLYGTDQVDVAYEPWRVRAPTSLRVGPASGAPAVRADSGEAVAFDAGQDVGRQSVRNPACRDVPPMRATVNGFVWVYGMPPASRKSGWVRLADLEADPTCPELACGPAGVDFDRRFPQACGGHCDGRPLAGVDATAGSAAVGARELYLRHAPASTAFRYLVAGDRVRLLARWRAGRWLGVQVRQAQWAPRGARGWVLADGVDRD